MADFATAFAELLGNEGGFTLNAKDPGNWTGGKVGSGLLIGTVWGLSAPVLVKHGFAANPGAVRAITKAQAEPIAKAEYWDVYLCDEMPQRVAFEVLDIAYNGGHTAEWLQKAVHANVTGKVDSATLVCLECADPDKVVMRLDSYRLTYWTSLGTWPAFGKGWINRIAANLLRDAA